MYLPTHGCAMHFCVINGMFSSLTSQSRESVGFWSARLLDLTSIRMRHLEGVESPKYLQSGKV